jgi:hypothetical protein
MFDDMDPRAPDNGDNGGSDNYSVAAERVKRCPNCVGEERCERHDARQLQMFIR